VVLVSLPREKGIGNKISPGTTKQMDNNRTAILRLLITCFSEALYLSPSGMYLRDRGDSQDIVIWSGRDCHVGFFVFLKETITNTFCW